MALGFLQDVYCLYFIVMIRLERYTDVCHIISQHTMVVAEDKIRGYFTESDVLPMKLERRTNVVELKINLISAVLVSLSLCGGCTLEKAETLGIRQYRR